MQVFLSYSRNDKAFVGRLKAELTGRRIDVWLDTEDLASADEDRWRRSIVQGIRESAALIVVLSPDSVMSGQVERELTIAAEAGRRIIPVVHRPCELPDGFQFELAGVQRIDFVEQPFDHALDQLVRRIGKITPVASAPPPFTPSTPVTPSSETVLHPRDPTTEPANVTERVIPAASTGVEAASSEPDALPPPLPTRRATRRDAAEVAAIPPTPAPPPAAPAATSAHVPAEHEPPPPSSRGRTRMWVFLAVSVVVLTLGTVGVIALLRGGRGAQADKPSPQTTNAARVTTTGVTAPGTSAGQGTQPPTSPPTEPQTTEGATPAPPNDESTALALVDELQRAYNARDWESVRRLNTIQRSYSDAKFLGGYGSLEKGFHRILSTEQTGATAWRVLGVILAWDDEADRGRTTNVACIDWEVDTAARTTAQGDFVGSDGRRSRRLDGWLPESQFDATAAKYCG
ncbi:MAG TPA: TIR domain-containing protein [Acidimicrobiales bacterium]